MIKQSNKVQIKKLGLITFQESLDYQNYLVEEKQKGLQDDFLLLLEHFPVYTMGKGACTENILDKSIKVITTNRGGDLTFHGPGQLIGYIILNLKLSRIDIHQYIRQIEEVIIQALNRTEINGYRVKNLTGIWASNKKIASIGIGVRKGITMHGFALNINPDLSYFSKINPCGLNSNIVSSIKELKNEPVSFQNIENFVIKEFLNIFGGIYD